MALTLAGFVFPTSGQGLRWSDEYAWTPVAQATAYGLTGALIVQEGTRTAGRPLTLAGGPRRAWLTRAQLGTLAALLASGDQRTLTIHDGRQIPVIPRHDGDGPLSADSLIDYANPDADTVYVVSAIRFLIVGAIVTPGP